MSVEIIIALFLGMGSLITAIWTSRSSATKTELDSLRLTIQDLRITMKDLQTENGRLQLQNDNLRDRVDELENKTQIQDKASACLADRVHELEVENKGLKAQVLILETDKERLVQENLLLLARITELEKVANDGRAGV